jgi:single-strand DNA-binding protein
MTSLNRVILIGRVVAQPDLRYTQNGKAVANFRLAVDRRGKNDEADFIPIVAWERLAEICGEFLTKGKLVAIEGRLQTRTYETKDGQKRSAFDIVADDMRMLSGRNEGEAQGAPAPAAAPTQRQASQRQASPATRQVVQQAWGPLPEDDGVPF